MSIQNIIFEHVGIRYMSPFECMKIRIHLTLFEIGEMVGSWFLMLISVERLLAMAWFNWYRATYHRYNMYFIVFICMYGLIDVTISWVGSSFLDQTKCISARCEHDLSVSSYYYTWHTLQMIICGYVSILTYLSALIILKINTKPGSTILAAQRKREATVTKRITLVITTTFIMQILPSTIYELHNDNSKFLEAIRPYVFILYSFTPCVNVFVYALQTHEFREKVKSLISFTK